MLLLHTLSKEIRDCTTTSWTSSSAAYSKNGQPILCSTNMGACTTCFGKSTSLAKNCANKIHAQTQNKTKRKSESPIEEIGFDQKTLELEFKSQYGEEGSKKLESSKAETMKTLPSFQGDYEARSDIQKLPSHKKHAPPTLDMICSLGSTH